MENLTITKARELLDKKEISARELSEFYLHNIEAKNKELNAYLSVYDDVLEQAEAAQKKIDIGEGKELTGIPIAVKDCILIKGKEATSASKILQGYKAPYSATVTQRIADQGGVFLGRTNMDEFACGGSTENSAFGVVHNPLDIERVPGGSSGGSAAAVAADMALAALGSDTGGSIREPAAFCGIVGLKPTYGAVSRYGLMAMGSSLDCIGPLTKTVADAEIIFNAIKGKDKFDSTSYEVRSTNREVKKIGVPYHLLELDGISAEVKTNFENSIKKLESLGFEIQEVKLPNIDKALAVYYILMPAEVSSNMARYDGMRYGLSVEGKDLLEVYKKTRGIGFGPEVRRRIILGTYVLSTGYYDAYYGKALKVRRLIRDEFATAFDTVDAIITPTAPGTAWKIGEKTNPLETYLADIFTVSANIAGIPGISVPAGLAENKMPLGLQILAPHMAEDKLFHIGKRFLGEIV